MSRTKEHELIHVTIRIDAAVHAKAMAYAKVDGGLNVVVKNAMVEFLSGKQQLQLAKWRADERNYGPKSKRVSLKLDAKLYQQAQLKSSNFGGVSVLVREILEQYCDR